MLLTLKVYMYYAYNYDQKTHVLETYNLKLLSRYSAQKFSCNLRKTRNYLSVISMYALIDRYLLPVSTISLPK